ncbi:MAG TPA: DUF4105 domain-containing protein [Parcubacteria group bacterium]|nr:DUF4105 domain-containing protein [Parcubacteria group bacterium]
MNLVNKISFKKIFKYLIFTFFVFLTWQFLKTPPLTGDWQQHLATPSIAEFNGDFVTVKNVRNYRYGPTEKDMQPGYYDRTYDLRDVKKVWYVTEPFNENEMAAHTFVSFEFGSGDFLSISIEARKTKDQVYSIWKGFMRTYPLMYVAADERDVILLRANLRKDRVYLYPIKIEKPENARLLLVDMLTTMNELVTTKPAWYNTLFANCTSAIAKHVNKLSPGRISTFSWRLWLTASADELAHKVGLIDTDLSIEEARKKYLINEASMKAGDVPNYSKFIRNFK